MPCWNQWRSAHSSGSPPGVAGPKLLPARWPEPRRSETSDTRSTRSSLWGHQETVKGHSDLFVPQNLYKEMLSQHWHRKCMLVSSTSLFLKRTCYPFSILSQQESQVRHWSLVPRSWESDQRPSPNAAVSAPSAPRPRPQPGVAAVHEAGAGAAAATVPPELPGSNVTC